MMSACGALLSPFSRDGACGGGFSCEREALNSPIQFLPESQGIRHPKALFLKPEAQEILEKRIQPKPVDRLSLFPGRKPLLKGPGKGVHEVFHLLIPSPLPEASGALDLHDPRYQIGHGPGMELRPEKWIGLQKPFK